MGTKPSSHEPFWGLLHIQSTRGTKRKDTGRPSLQERRYSLYVYNSTFATVCSSQGSAMGYIVYSYPSSCLPGALGSDLVCKEDIWKCLEVCDRATLDLGPSLIPRPQTPTEGGEATAKYEGKKVIWRLKSQVKQRSFGATRNFWKKNPHAAFRENKILLTSWFLHLWFLEICFFKSFIFPLFFDFYGSHRKLVQTWGIMHLLPSQFWKGRYRENVLLPPFGICLCLLYITIQYEK